MKKSDGFTLTETLVAFSVVMVLIATAVPIMVLLNNERVNLSTRLSATSQLHDDLQERLWDISSNTPSHYTKIVDTKTVDFTFTNEDNFKKGCASWTNERPAEERICLYGRLSK